MTLYYYKSLSGGKDEGLYALQMGFLAHIHKIVARHHIVCMYVMTVYIEKSHNNVGCRLGIYT